jgi:DNA-binding response OmpR family regulator
VIVDVGLPDVTPTVLTRFVRSRQSVESVCLIGTAQGLSEAQGQALLQAGFDGYIGKPFDVRSLVELIEHKRNGVGAPVES